MQPSKVPPLDSYLAAPCDDIPEFPGGDYDAWQLWVQEKLIPAYTNCAIRHAKTVKAWPK